MGFLTLKRSMRKKDGMSSANTNSQIWMSSQSLTV